VSHLRRLLQETTAQDVVEYALLAAFIGVSTVAAAPVITTALTTAYSLWDSGVQALWEPAPPG